MRISPVASLRGIVMASALVFLAAGCDPGLSGPGEWSGRIQATAAPLGGVVLEVVGTGIQDFTASGGTKVIWASTGAVETYRVIAINEVAGDVQFQISVLDMGAGKPRALIVNLVDGDNLPLPVTGNYEVSISN